MDGTGRRTRRVAVLLLVAAMLAFQAGSPAAARATEHESYGLSGYEVFYSPTRAMFAGTSGDGLGGVSAWYSSIDHSVVISPSGAITGGWAVLYRPDGVRIEGWFSEGQVTLTNEGPACTLESHEVVGTLTSVTRSDRGGSGSGVFRATLHHHRAWLFGTCISYSASVSGTLEISF